MGKVFSRPNESRPRKKYVATVEPDKITTRRARREDTHDDRRRRSRSGHRDQKGSRRRHRSRTRSRHHDEGRANDHGQMTALSRGESEYDRSYNPSCVERVKEQFTRDSYTRDANGGVKHFKEAYSKFRTPDGRSYEVHATSMGYDPDGDRLLRQQEEKVPPRLGRRRKENATFDGHYHTEDRRPRNRSESGSSRGRSAANSPSDDELPSAHR